MSGARRQLWEQQWADSFDGRDLGAAPPTRGTPPAGYSMEADKNPGMLSVSEAMMILAFVVLASFLLYMTALDVSRDETYEKLKDEALRRSKNPNNVKPLPKERSLMY